jgi:hypothetical protein
VHVLADPVDDACDLVPGHDRIRDTGEVPLLGVGVAVANTAGLHPDPDLTRSRLRNLPLAELERTAGLGYLHDSHRAWRLLSHERPCPEHSDHRRPFARP